MASASSNPRPRLLFVAGPTAVGKTEAVLRWAESHQALVLSCDSLCVYRGMDIGTAKPTAAERVRVPHAGLDLVEADTPFSVAEYHAHAAEVLAAAHQRGQPVVVAGGTGFYLKGFFAPVTDSVAVPEAVRAEVIALEQAGGLSALMTRLLALNPAGLGALDTRNPRRVARALERCLASGRTVLDLAAAFAAQAEPYAEYAKRLVLLEREAAELHARVRQRVRQMIEGGLIDEVRCLRAAGFERNPSACGSIGYRETLAWLDAGEPGGVEALAAEIAVHTDQLIRKQRSWFRKQVPIAQVLPAGAVLDGEA